MGIGQKKSVAPVEEATTEVFILNERAMFHRVREGLGEHISMALGEALRDKSWKIPVGSHRNPFWRVARCLSSPGDTNTLLSQSLVVACSLGSAQLVRNLLESGADPSCLPGQWGAIHSAAYHGDVRVLRELLADPRTQVSVPERKGRTPLHLAAWKGNVEAMRVLLQREEDLLNQTDQCGNTALHLAVSSSLQGEAPSDRFLQSISLLLDQSELALNLPDKDGLTALGRAVMLARETLARTIMAHPRHICNVDTFLAGYFGPTIREKVLGSYPGLVKLLPLHLMDQESPYLKSCKLLVALLAGELDTFLSLLQASPELAERFYGEPLHCSLPEVACLLDGRAQFLALLIDVGANPNAVNPVTMLPLLHTAARRGNAAAVDVLLKAPDVQPNVRDCFRRTPLHYLTQAQNSGSKLRHVLTQLLDRGAGTDVNATAASGETPLHVAARLGDEETVLVLLNNGADIMFSTSGLEPPLAHIAPDVVEKFLDESIEGSEEAPTHEDFALTFRYSALLPGKRSEMTVLRYLSRRPHLRHLLAHPTAASFLYLKWQRVRKIYIVNFVLYCVFLSLLTWYSLLIGREDATSQRNTVGYLLCGVLAVLVLSELVQLVTSPRLYLATPANVVEFFIKLWLMKNFIELHVGMCITAFTKQKVAVLISTVNLLAWPGHSDAIPQCSAVAVLLSWTKFVIFIGGFPMLSVPLEMLRSVAWTSLRFTACYCPLLLAFAFSFFVMFRTTREQQQEEQSDLNDFPTVGLSMLKTFVMFAGEFEAADVEFQRAPYTSHIMFVVFVFLVSIVLLNLLNGLAVSDTQSIRANAEILSLTARVKLVTYLEAMNSCIGMTRRWFSVTAQLLTSDKTYTVFPNRPKGYRHKWRRVQVDGALVRNGDMDPEIVVRAVALLTERRKSCKEDLFRTNAIKEISQQVNDLCKRFQQVETKLEVILSRINQK